MEKTGTLSEPQGAVEGAAHRSNVPERTLNALIAPLSISFPAQFKSGEEHIGNDQNMLF